MPAPYTDAEQDDLIDQLLADVAALTTRVDDLETRMTAAETTLGIIEPIVTDLQATVGTLETDVTTANANIGTLQADVLDIGERLTTVESVTLPAVETVQEDVQALRVSSKNRQEADPNELGKPQVVLRPSIERVRRPDGKLAQRTVRPR